MTDNICLSGGANGADLAWGELAHSLGHSVIHYSFQGARTKALAADVVVLTPEQLAAADEPCKRASGAIKRWFPPKNLYVKNLLRRNWHQVNQTERVYAVANVQDEMVSGGTAWAVQMFLDRHDGQACECYVFDQITNRWFEWAGRWMPINQPPKPVGIWTGIGSRELTDEGHQAIVSFGAN